MPIIDVGDIKTLRVVGDEDIGWRDIWWRNVRKAFGKELHECVLKVSRDRKDNPSAIKEKNSMVCKKSAKEVVVGSYGRTKVRTQDSLHGNNKKEVIPLKPFITPTLEG